MQSVIIRQSISKKKWNDGLRVVVLKIRTENGGTGNALGNN